MLQEGVDHLALKTLYNNEPLEIYYKCHGVHETLLTTKVTQTIDGLPKTWDQLFVQEPNILAMYHKVQDQCNKTLQVETHIKSDTVKLIYYNHTSK